MPCPPHAAAVVWRRVALLALLAAAAAAASTDPDLQTSRHAALLERHKAYEAHPLVQLLAAIRTSGPVSACPPADRGLPREPVDQTKHYLFASNLVNSAKVLPQIITQLVPALLTFRTHHVHVSIYESGSFDNTREWLRLLQQLLDSLRIPNTIVTDGVTRGTSDRIEFLSTIRNHALAPMLRAAAPPSNATAGARKVKAIPDDDSSPPDAGDTDADGPDASTPAHATDPTAPFPADHVVFFNDVTFCAQDVLRLLQHAPSTDIACGLDLQNWAGSAWSPAPNFTHLASLIPARMPPMPHGLRRFLLGAWQTRFAPSDAPHPIRPLQFYDNWVGHDLDGRGLRVEYPYANVPASRERATRGLPFPVQCCWNGLAVLRAAPLRAGLRFRSHVAGECYESECTLLCDDYWRLGYGRVLIDPSVRVTYCPSLYPFAHATSRPVSTWREALADPVNWAKVAPPARTECCEGSDWGDCRLHFPWLERNYTDVAIKSGFAPSKVCYATNTSRDKCPVPALLAATSPAEQAKPARRAASAPRDAVAAGGGSNRSGQRSAGLRGSVAGEWMVDRRRRRLLHGMTGVPQ